MKKLHICFVESGYPHPHGGGGGAGTRIRLIARELIERGHSVSVVTSFCEQCPQISCDEGINVYRQRQYVPIHWYWSKLPGIGSDALSIRYLEQGLQYARTLNWLHTKKPIDLAEYTEGGDFWHAWTSPFLRVSFLSGSRYTFLKESGRQVTRKDWWQRRLELMFIRRADHVISPSKAMQSIVEFELGTSLSNITILSNPIDPLLIKSIDDPIFEDHEESPIIMFAARNDWVKGGDLLLQAALEVQGAIPTAQFQFFGFSRPTNVEVPYKINFYPFVPKEMLLQHYKQATICVVPSRWDNSPNTVYEAMAAGKPVIATRVGGIPEIVVDGETGILVEPNDPQQLARALIFLLSNKTLLETMGLNGRKYAQTTFDLEHHVDERLRLFLQLRTRSNNSIVSPVVNTN